MSPGGLRLEAIADDCHPKMVAGYLPSGRRELMAEKPDLLGSVVVVDRRVGERVGKKREREGRKRREHGGDEQGRKGREGAEREKIFKPSIMLMH